MFVPQKPYSELRLLLIVIAAVKVLAAVLLLLFPAWVISFFADVTYDIGHQYLLMGLATFLIVLAIGSLLAMLRPLQNRGTITLLAIDHFAIFLLDLIILVRGSDISWYLLLPEMIYTLGVSVLLIRFFPVADYAAELRETADELVGQVRKNLKKETPTDKPDTASTPPLS